MKEMDFNKQLVPFGKYQGQPISVMQNDTQYCEWLSTQDWFRERYANVYNQVIVNNFTEPTETPEHNRLQMLFLDNEFVKRLERFVFPDVFGAFKEEISRYIQIYDKDIEETSQKIKQLENEKSEILKFTNENERKIALESFSGNDLSSYAFKSKWEHRLKNYNKEYEVTELAKIEEDLQEKQTILNEFKTQKERFVKATTNIDCYSLEISNIDFECYGWDVFYDVKLTFLNDKLKKLGERCVEIKPCLGDDFPAVLRQMKNNSNMRVPTSSGRSMVIPNERYKILIIDEFTAQGATWEQVVKTFELSNITLLKFSDVQGGYINA